jgi:hypothetical protein
METNEDRATKLDNDHALIALRGAGLPALPESGVALPRARRGAWLGSLVGLAVFGAVSAAAAFAAGVVTARRRNKGWYRRLRNSSRALSALGIAKLIARR